MHSLLGLCSALGQNLREGNAALLVANTLTWSEKVDIRKRFMMAEGSALSSRAGDKRLFTTVV